jgi:hypothetical protein
MNKTLKNVFGFIIAAVIGMVVNSGLIRLGLVLFPLPEGVVPGDMESIAANLDKFAPGNYVMSFLAHALGTLVGALVALKLCASSQLKFAYGIGVFFLLGGIAAAFVIPAPTWFIIFDLVLAYIPMAWVATKILPPKTT